MIPKIKLLFVSFLLFILFEPNWLAVARSVPVTSEEDNITTLGAASKLFLAKPVSASSNASAVADRTFTPNANDNTVVANKDKNSTTDGVVTSAVNAITAIENNATAHGNSARNKQDIAAVIQNNASTFEALVPSGHSQDEPEKGPVGTTDLVLPGNVPGNSRNNGTVKTPTIETLNSLQGPRTLSHTIIVNPTGKEPYFPKNDPQIAQDKEKAAIAKNRTRAFKTDFEQQPMLGESDPEIGSAKEQESLLVQSPDSKVPTVAGPNSRLSSKIQTGSKTETGSDIGSGAPTSQTSSVTSIQKSSLVALKQKSPVEFSAQDRQISIQKSSVVPSDRKSTVSLTDPTSSLPLKELSCPLGTYGEDCNQQCGHCEGGNEKCNPTNGVCQAGCESGWLGVRCQTACGPGTWGDRCYGCGHCLEGDSQCDKVNGTCNKGCQSGWYGLKCISQCGKCMYGPGSCDKVTGWCEGGCMPGWRGRTCHAPCGPKHWGENCAQVCGQCAEDSCNSFDGRCAKGCTPGWTDDYCTTPCNGNTYGPDCNVTCGHCQKEKGSTLPYVTCDRETGQCSTGCDPGWQGERCDALCPNGTYGLNCSQTCPDCGEHPGECTCNPITGACDYGLCPASIKGIYPVNSALVAVSATESVLLVAAVVAVAAYAIHRHRRTRQTNTNQDNDKNGDSTGAEDSSTNGVSAGCSGQGASYADDSSDCPDTHDPPDGAP